MRTNLNQQNSYFNFFLSWDHFLRYLGHFRLIFVKYVKHELHFAQSQNAENPDINYYKRLKISSKVVSKLRH